MRQPPSRTRAGLLATILLACTSIVLPAAAQHKGIGTQKKQALDEQKWMTQCQTGDASLTDSQCALWVSRKEFVQKAKCPTRDDNSSGCASFQELIKDDDADMRRDFAQQDHVYACFRPEEDVFLEIYFSDATAAPPLPGSAALPGSVGVRYYKNGIASATMSFHNSGQWKYRPVAGQTNRGGLVFTSENVSIAGSKFEALQTYKNESGLEIHHSLALQLSTGRFNEKYQMEPSGETVDDYSGRCFVMPTASH